MISFERVSKRYAEGFDALRDLSFMIEKRSKS
jgi:ABC-type ATPase involved in cell division